ncbi:hypothetical protein GCM10007989_07050 [Devosia pacifica]|uniref:HPt domain-containing protein n=1 Tax=Devosia pacifica TaxID=1335967 RepID=A0A918RX85_9HYPH|nr:Hpt domain-containing protein [Devosia pacifica]GHA14926.1 hypothetical protein GCM10007989_07050 [Devosia pacifica]
MAATAKSYGVSGQYLQEQSDRLIDRGHLTGQCLGDPGLEVEVLRNFDAMIATYAKRLKQATRREDLMVLLHTVRGAAAGVGANPLAKRVREAEHELAQSGTLGSESILEITHAIEEVRVHISELAPEEF